MIKAIFKTFFLSLAIIANVHFAYGQTGGIIPNGKNVFLDQNGKPLSSGKVFFYVPSTTTPKTTYSDINLSIPNTNPVVLDAAGRAILWGTGNYRQIVQDKNSNTIWDVTTSAAGSGSGGGGTVTSGDGDLVGTIKPWAGITAPNQYMFTYGQEISRTTFAAVFTTITSTQAVFCNSGSPILSGLGDTTSFWIGMSVEVGCVSGGVSTIISKTSSSVTLAANANLTQNVNAIFFPWGRGNGTTTFNLPDFRGLIPVGNNIMGGVASSNINDTYFGSKGSSSAGAQGGSSNGGSVALTINNFPSYTPSGTVALRSTSVNAPPVAVENGQVAVASADGSGTPRSIYVAGSFALTSASFAGTQQGGGGIAATATVAVAGSGYTNGSQTITVAGGTCSVQPQFTVTVSGNAFSGTPSLLTAGNCTAAPTNPASTTGGGGTGGTLNVVYSSQPFGILPPQKTVNYIIKVTPDTSSFIGAIDAANISFTAVGGATTNVAARLKTIYTATDYAGVDPTGATDSSGGFRTALAAVPDGGTLYVPWGTYKLSSCVNNAIFDFTPFPNKGIKIKGVGWTFAGGGSTMQGTSFILDSSIPNTCDFYHQAPTIAVQGNIAFEDFAVSPIGGVYTTPYGRHGFNFEAPNANSYMENVHFYNVFVDNMNAGYSINVIGFAGGTGLLTNGVFSHNHLMNINATNIGDQNKFLYNIIGANATNDSRNVGLYFYQVSGATNTIVRDNFIANATCIIDDGSIKSVYDGNTCELIVTNSTGFMIWMKGSQFAVSTATITNNRISNLVAATTYVPIQIDNAAGTSVARNYMSTPTLYNQIVSSASSFSTFVEASNETYVGSSAQTDIAVGYASSTNSIVNSRTFSTWPLASDPGVPAIGYILQFMNTTNGIPNWETHAGKHYFPVAGPSAVLSLPTCNSGADGLRAFVIDNNTSTTFGGAVTTGGSNHHPVYCDGSATAWKQG